MSTRSPAEIRRTMQSNRAELALSIDRLRGEITRLTDWRGQLERHRTQVTVGVALVGVAIGMRMLRRRRRGED
jgi:uncharacterized membrane protein